MSWSLTLRALLLSASGALAAAAAIPPELPVETFFGNPAIAQLRFSPNGRYLAALMPHERRLNLVVMDLEKKSKQFITAFKDYSVSSYQWANDERLVLLIDDDGDEDFLPFAIDRDGGRFTKFDDTKGISGLVRRDPANPRRILVQSNQTHRDRSDPCWLDVNTGRISVITPNPGKVDRWVIDRAHVVRFAIASEGLEETILYRDHAGEDWRTLAVFPDGQPGWRPLAFDADNRTVFIASDEGRDTLAIYRYDTATHTRGSLVHADPRYDVDEVVWDDALERVVAVAYTTDRRRVVPIDETYGRRQGIIEAAFPGMTCSQVQATGQGANTAVFVSSDREPGVYYLLDEKRKKLEEIAVVRPKIDPEQMAAMRAVRFRARDGLELEAMLTLPPGREPKGLPLVINPHGGPFGPRDEWRFSSEVQFLANRGFAVLQPNFRGSGGYGRAFERAGYRQWGRAMQDDLTDAVKWAVAEGLADPARVVIMGASYGGYAVMAGLAFTPELYCAGVNYVGVTDLTIITRQGRGSEGGKQWRRTRVGDVYDNAAELRAWSPVNHAEKIRVPVLMAYGKSDPRVTRDHGDDMQAALKKHGRTFEFVMEAGEGHGFRKEEKSVGYYSRVDAFLKAHVPGLAVGPGR